MPELAGDLGTENLQSPALPPIGFGTYGMEGEECQRAVQSALELGYRLFDCAEIYGNEVEVGSALASSSMSRDDMYIISKFWFSHNDPANMRRSLDTSLRKMNLEWFDLYMLHWPSAEMNLPAILTALHEAQGEGLIRQLGICNFPHHKLEKLVEQSDVSLGAVELEWHVYLDQSATHRLLNAHRIPFIAYSPMAQGRACDDPVLEDIGKRHGVSGSTIALAWLVSHPGVTAIPKSRSSEHQIANLSAATVTLSKDEMERIARLPKNVRLADFPFSPNWDE